MHGVHHMSVSRWLFSKDLLSTYCVPGSMIGAQTTVLIKTLTGPRMEISLSRLLMAASFHKDVLTEGTDND